MISEYQYWIIQQKLEETLQQYLDQPEQQGEDGPEQAEVYELLENEKLQQFVYEELGVVGGAYILADISRNELLLLQNKELQPKLFQNNPKLPFIGIPYKYPTIEEKTNRPSSKFSINVDFNELVDALFIGTQDRQTIDDSLINSPHFYQFLPHLLSEEQLQGLLPFERKLVKNGQKVIYCTVGEVLFNLYLWRILFRLIQRETLKGQINRDTYDEYFEMRSRFWEQMSALEKEQIIISETDWLKALKYRYEENDPIHGETNQRIREKWERLTREVDADLLLDSNQYTFYEEYFHMGLVDDQDHASRGLLALVRFTIHIAKSHLGWNTGQGISEENVDTSTNPRDQRNTPTNILNRLYTLERHLNKFFSLGIDADETDIVTYEHLGGAYYQLDCCIQKVAKAYLFKSILKTKEPQASLLKALINLHQQTRFPILPYFYELVLGKVHTPKEHLMINIWNSNETGVKLNLPTHGRIKESAVAFLAISLRPIWKLEPNKYFTQNNESIYWANKLSEYAYIRLARITSFFRTLSRPLIDQIFYGQIMKKQIQQVSTSTDINALSHEMSKIVDNIFELSNMSLFELFGYDEKKISLAANFLSNLSLEKHDNHNQLVKLGLEQHKNYIFRPKDVENWRIIPNYDRFKIWNKYLNMWVGRRGNFILDINDDTELVTILDESHQLAARMHMGAQMQNVGKAFNYEKVRDYHQNFEGNLEELLGPKPRIVFEENHLQRLKLRSLNCDKDGKQVIKQNAFLRTLLASTTNIFEHSRGSYYLDLRLKEDLKGQKGLRFCFVNPCAKRGNHGTSEGTLPVLESCLVLVAGELEYFGCPRRETYKKYWATKAEIDLEQYDIWLTKFIIPLQDIFADH